MMRFLMIAAAASSLLAQSALAQTATSAPLQPTGPWNVNYAANSCVVSHNFGAGADKIDLAFQVLPRSSGATVAVSVPGMKAGRGKATLTLQPAGPAIKTDFSTVPGPDGWGTAIFRILNDDDFDRVIRATQIRVVAGKSLDVTLAPKQMPDAFRAADACKDDLLRTWHIDPVLLATASTPAKPKGSPGNWVTNDDYPSSSISKGESGMTVFRLTVGTTGAVTACGILATSGSKVLDTQVCALMMRRAQFEPARDLNGKPVPDVYVQRFRWEM